MVENVGIVGAIATAGMIVRQALILAIALRGTKPSERPAIIRALTGLTRSTREQLTRRQRTPGE
jgi:hypothetical protein